MTNQRIHTAVSLTVQFDNPYQPPQWGMPVLMTQVVTVKDVNGTDLYTPSHQMLPAVAADVTDEMLAALQTKLASIGLAVSRVEQ